MHSGKVVIFLRPLNHLLALVTEPVDSRARERVHGVPIIARFRSGGEKEEEGGGGTREEEGREEREGMYLSLGTGAKQLVHV